MRRFILLIFLCCLTLGISAQTAKEEIFENIHLSAANHYAYPDPDFKKTPPPSGYKPFYLSHYARHGSRYRVNPNDYKEPLRILCEAEKDGALTELGKNALNLISLLHITSGLGVRPARYSAKKYSNTRSQYSFSKLTE